MQFLDFRRKVGQNVKKLRESKGITQEGMDTEPDAVSHRTVQDVENGEREVYLSTIFRIAKKLGIEPHELLRID